MIKVGIIGGAGYTGGELIRILLNHPKATIVFVHSNSNAGNKISDVHADLIDVNLYFSHDEALKNLQQNGAIDVLFLCLGHGASRQFLQNNEVHSSIKIIDLANDFRLNNMSHFQDRKFVYGLPELQKNAIATAHNIANPGCFATAIQLGLLPLAKAGLLTQDIYTTGITGATGAGQSLSATSHFPWRENNIQAYKTLCHQHLKEIYQSLHQLEPSFLESPVWATEEDKGLYFVPWRGDFTRGIFVSSTITCQAMIEDLLPIYRDFYKDARFTFVSEQPVFLKQVVNTNNCVISLEKVGSKLVIHTVIDNLLKGASGQAVQNMNIMFGLPEQEGLQLKANFF